MKILQEYPRANGPLSVRSPPVRTRCRDARDPAVHDRAILARAALPHALVLRVRGVALGRLPRRGHEILMIPLEPLTLSVEGPDGAVRERSLRPHTLSWLPAAHPARFAADGRAEMLLVLVSRERLRGVAERPEPCGAVRAAPMLDVDHPDVSLLGTALARLLAGPGEAHRTFLPPVVDWLVARGTRERELAWSRAREVRGPRTSRGLSAEALEATLHRIEERLAEPVMVSALARELDMSDSSFSRAFKASVGVSPSRYMRDRRVARARRLLETTDMALIDVTFETGFSSQSHMTYVFVRELGVTPGRYRSSLREDSTASEGAPPAALEAIAS